MKRILYATTDPRATQRELANARLARSICADGIVLLENDGALPLTGGRVALYGYGARHPSYGGTGSGENNPRACVNVEQGFLNGGWTVENTAWLDAYDAVCERAREEWRLDLIAGMKRCSPMKAMDYSSAHPFMPPAAPPVTAVDVSSAAGEPAVYVLTRQAGEGADRRTVPGEYLIRDDELAELGALCARYRSVTLVLNVGGIVDLDFADGLGLSAIVYMMQGGMETGNALFDVLTGAVAPGGRLTDTWARRYEDYPCHDTFPGCGGDPFEADYREGIYVGYRYFDATGAVPRYAFGYGLSYTSFEVVPGAVSVEKTRVCVSAYVRNTGEAYAGRAVVQWYLSAPEGTFGREPQSLAAFAKTRALAPGESETLTSRFDLRDHAAYDAAHARFVLEAGEYRLFVGQDSRRTVPAAVLELDADAVTEQAAPVCPLREPLEPLPIPPRVRGPIDAPRHAVCAADFACITHVYETPAPYQSPEVDRIMERLSLREQVALLNGTSFVGPTHRTVFGAVGTTTSALVHKGVPNMPMADGPQGLNLKREARLPGQNCFTLPVLPEAVRLSPAGRFLRRFEAKPRASEPTYYQFCTAWPCAALTAQTWDLPLLEQMGDAIGREMEEMGVTYWLAPALNIHRNPLCGRNYEYYSEDPLLSGKLAAAVTRGVQRHKGRFATLKHFACNNLETERNRSSSNVDERTLREIYLKGFRIAVTEGGAKAVMTSYNRINGVYAPNSYDLLTKVLRCEWGFAHLVMTDWFGTGHHESRDALCCKAGNDLVMPGTPLVPPRIRAALRRGEITPLDVARAARNIVRAALESADGAAPTGDRPSQDKGERT